MGTVIKDGEDYVSFAFEVNQKIVTLREKELQWLKMQYFFKEDLVVLGGI